MNPYARLNIFFEIASHQMTGGSRPSWLVSRKRSTKYHKHTQASMTGR